jgi:HSP20 family protein
MTDTGNKVPVTKAEQTTDTPQAWRPFEHLHREIDRLFQDFGREFRRFPFRRPSLDVGGFDFAAPAVDIVEKENAYEITADLPGYDEKNISVEMSDGTLTIKGEQRQEKEETKKNYHLCERHFGSFERSFIVPEAADKEKISANFRKGVLTVTLPKRAESETAMRKIEVKAA